jgi:hypothetical protein
MAPRGKVMAAGLVVGLILLAGCSGEPQPPEAGAYACERCLWTADDGATRSHFETFLASSPVDDQHLVAASSWFDGERFQVTTLTSFDQGRTWSVAELPYGDDMPVGHPLATINFAGDPGVAISPDGHTVVVSAVGLTTVPAQQLQGNVPVQDVMFVARSDDGGRTFPPENAVVLQQAAQAYPAVQEFSDHPRIVAAADGTFLVMWGSLDLPDPTRAARFVQTQDVLLASSLEVRYSTSTDGGRTWSAPAVAYRDTDLHYYPPSPVILPDGRWLLMPNEYNGGDGDVFVSVSDDKGASWSWDPTPMKASGFGTPAVTPDGRLAYSYNELVRGGSSPVLPVLPRLAVAAGPGEPWTEHALTDEPMAKRMGIENMVVADGRGAIHVLYEWMPSGATQGELRLATLHPDGTLTQTTVETALDPERGFGHYVGLAGTATGAVGTWPDVIAVPGQLWQPGGALVGSTVTWQSA